MKDTFLQLLNELEIAFPKTNGIPRREDVIAQGASGLVYFWATIRNTNYWQAEHNNSEGEHDYCHSAWSIFAEYFEIDNFILRGDYESVIRLYLKLFNYIDNAKIPRKTKRFYLELTKDLHPPEMGFLLYYICAIRSPRCAYKWWIKTVQKHNLLKHAVEVKVLTENHQRYFDTLLERPCDQSKAT